MTSQSARRVGSRCSRQTVAALRATRQVEKVYGTLVAEVGKAAAERFFPKAATPSKAATKAKEAAAKTDDTTAAPAK